VHQRRREQEYEGEQNNSEAIPQAMHCEMFPASSGKAAKAALPFWLKHDPELLPDSGSSSRQDHIRNIERGKLMTRRRTSW
jgi:hypothetical protein